MTMSSFNRILLLNGVKIIMKETYESTKKFVKEYLFSKNVSEQEKWVRYEHTLRVTKIGKEIAEKEHMDMDVVILGYLLHDVGKFDVEDEKEHGRVSAHIAQAFLQNMGMKEDKIARIYHGIAIHVDGKSDIDYPDFIEAETISDCDNIDRLDIYRAYETLNWKQFSAMNRTQGLALLHELLQKIESLQTDSLASDTATVLFYDALQKQHQFYSAMKEQYLRTF